MYLINRTAGDTSEFVVVRSRSDKKRAVLTVISGDILNFVFWLISCIKTKYNRRL